MPLETQKPQGQDEQLYTPPGPQPIVFEDFSGGLNTNSTRPGIKDNELWWADGFFPIAPNYLRTIPDVGLPIYEASGGGGGHVDTQLWVAGSSCELMEWSLSATGNVAPDVNIQGTTTTLTGPEGGNNSFTYAVDFDTVGNQFCLNQVLESDLTTHLYSIPVFAAGATGDIAPIRNIQGSNTQFSTFFGNEEVSGGGICLDASNQIYVGSKSFILKFPSGSDGNATSAVFLNDVTINSISSLHYDKDRELIWVSAGTPEIRAYDLLGVMQRQITYGDFNLPSEVFVGPDGSIFVGDVPSDLGPVVYVFEATANGASTPIRTILLTAGTKVSLVAVAVDSAGITYASYQDSLNKSHVVSYAKNADGAASPLTDISGDITFLDNMIDGTNTAPSHLNVR